MTENKNNISFLIVSFVIALQAFAPVDTFAQRKNWWGKTKYDGPAWVRNVSRPNDIDRGLDGHHISLWASHGRYYMHAKD